MNIYNVLFIWVIFLFLVLLLCGQFFFSEQEPNEQIHYKRSAAAEAIPTMILYLYSGYSHYRVTKASKMEKASIFILRHNTNDGSFKQPQKAYNERWRMLLPGQPSTHSQNKFTHSEMIRLHIKKHQKVYSQSWYPLHKQDHQEPRILKE